MCASLFVPQFHELQTLKVSGRIGPIYVTFVRIVLLSLVSGVPIATFSGAPALARADVKNQVCTKVVTPTDDIRGVTDGLVAGDVLCIEPGTYRQALFVRASGTKVFPIIIRGYNGRPIFDGDNALPTRNKEDLSASKLGCPGDLQSKDLSGKAGPSMHFECTGWHPLVAVSGSYVILEGIEVVRSTGIGIGVGTMPPAYVQGVVVRNNFVHSTRYTGIDLQNVRHAIVENNEVTASSVFAPFRHAATVANWGAGVSGRAIDDVVFRNNIIHDNWGDALLVDTNTGRSSNVVISDNVFYDNYSSNGVYAHAVRNVIIERNLIYCSSHNQVYSWSSLLIAPSESDFEPDIDTENVAIKNNVFANCNNAGIVFWATRPRGRSVSRVTVTNNTLFQNGTDVKAPKSKQLRDISIANNLILDGAHASALLLGSDEKGNIPPEFRAGKVNITWFRQQRYEGVGADLSQGARAGRPGLN